MRDVFADTVYWVAILNPKDQFHISAIESSKTIGSSLIYTTDSVLTEVLNEFSGKGDFWRNKASEAVKRIMQNPNVKVIPQTREIFAKGLGLYNSRPDKEYSLVDCISMVLMKENQMTEILTDDKHFEQEGYVLLLKQT
ncbi:MAG: PIN domain-containing protein [Bacteroidota bacterium]